MKSKVYVVALVAVLAAFGCGDKKEGVAGQSATGAADVPAAKADTKSLANADVIRLDGSSTVYPISQAVAEEFQRKYGARVTIGVSGTGGGFKKFCRGETDLTGASRPIKPIEVDACKEAGIEFIELPVAYDGIAVVVHKGNDWVGSMTVAELKAMWEPEATDRGIKKWSQIRKGWPDKNFNLFGPGVDSGTFDYFTAAIVGKEQASRGDFTASEDDNVLVQGVATDPNALGFFGYAYYQENTDKLKVVPIDNGDGPVAPTLETVAKGSYQPLSRPIFFYLNKQRLARPEVKTFAEFYLGTESRPLVKEVGYIPLPDRAYELALERLAKGVAGSIFEGGSKIGVTIEEMLQGR